MTHILIVDDKDENLAYLRTLLTSHGYTVESALDGAEALLKALQAPPDVVISDLLMPVMDGYALLRHWKADAGLKTIPFIVYTATYIDSEDERLALALGADAFILKPSDPEHFIARLREVMANAASACRVPLSSAVPDEGTQLKLYNDTLIRKLEERTLQLEAANRALHGDIARRKATEGALRTSEATMAVAQRIAHFGSWELDLTMTEVNANPLRWSDEMFRIAGYEPGAVEVSNDLFFSAVPVGEQEAIRQAVAEAIQGHGEYSIVHRLIRPGGEERIVHEFAQIFFDEKTGAPLKMVGTAQDITERKRSEEALRTSAKEFHDLAEAMPQIVWITRPDGWNTYFNQHWMDYTGLTLEESNGHGWNRPFHPDDRQRAWEAWQHATAAIDTYALECRLRRADGSYRWWLIRGVPLRGIDGNIAKWIGTCTDIHDLKQAEIDLFNANKALRATEEKFRHLNVELEDRVLVRTREMNQARVDADAANQAKSAFLAAMSHEIRTPMNGVIGMVDVLHRTSLRGDQVEMVDLIRDSAYSLLSIIDDILDFSKIEAGRMEIESAPLCLADLVESVCGMLDHTAIKRDVRMALFVDPAIPPWLVGDEVRLRQVLVNLIGNAIKFCGGREWPGRIAVRTRLRACDAVAATVELSVSDNGIGMDEATRARLFKPFTQGDASTTRRFGGTGLGLAISGTLVNLLGGEISVRSAPDQGATFTVLLTLARAEGVVVIEPAAALIAGLRCCIIGSDMPLADDLTAHLKCAGVSVERAMEPAEAGAAPLWLLLPSQSQISIEAVRALAARAGGSETRFFYLGSGYRRRAHVEAPDVVLLDHCGLTRRSLYRAVALASGRLTTDDSAVLGLGQEADGKGSRLEVGKILVAEDNETNRKVIQQQLHLLGFEAEFAEDGQHALHLWRNGKFSLIFTDLFMPRMDGYALAAAIRAEEKGTRRTSIVALTANAVHGEELRCRAAGMDAYLTKPVRLPRLQAAIAEWLPRAAEMAVGSGELDNSQGHALSDALEAKPVLDLGVLKNLIGDDEAVVADVLSAFLGSVSGSGKLLSQLCADGDLPGVADAAHKLKSGADSVGALQLGQRCSELEMAAGAGQHDVVAALMPLYTDDLQAVLQSLARP